MHPCVSDGDCFVRGAEVELHPYSMDVKVIFPVVVTKIDEILKSKWPFSYKKSKNFMLYDQEFLKLLSFSRMKKFWLKQYLTYNSASEVIVEQGCEVYSGGFLRTPPGKMERKPNAWPSGYRTKGYYLTLVTGKGNKTVTSSKCILKVNEVDS